MALVLDSQTIPERDRVEALNAAFRNSEAPQAVTYNTNGPIRHRMDLFDLGPGTHLLRNTGTGLRCTPRCCCASKCISTPTCTTGN